MPRALVHTTACHFVKINPVSRKAQEKFNVREIPGRVNYTHLVDVSTGLDSWYGGDLVTILQAHYVKSRAFRLSESELMVTPILTFLDGVTYSAAQLQVFLKQKAIQHNVDPATVTLHGLRNSQVTRAVNGDLQDNPVALLALAGHASLQSQRPYQQLGVGMAEAVTKALKY